MLGCMSAYVSTSWQENREAGETLDSLFLDVFCSSKAPMVDVDLGRRRGPFLPIKQRQRVPAAMAQVPFSTFFFFLLLLSGVSTFKFDKHKSLAVETGFLQLGAAVKVTVPNLAT